MGRKDSMLIYDTFSVKVPELNVDKMSEFMVEDADGVTLMRGRSLLTKLAASHWGYINKNAFYYDPDTVDGSIPTWTMPFKKPVLPYHPRGDDTTVPVLGRIIGATYREGVARNYIEDSVIPDNKPHGHLEFLTRIGDEAAIPAVIDGRLDTVSISANAVNVRCSICGEKVAVEDSTCTHQRFRRYDGDGKVDPSGKLCYYTAGPLLGRHIAFVLSPSDVYAGVKGAEFEDESTATAMDTEAALMELFVLSEQDRLMLNLHDASSMNLFDYIEDGERKSTIFDMFNIENQHTDDNREEGRNMDKLTPDDLASMTDEEIDALDEGQLTEDAKLTYAARKRLPDSAFCGPDRSFPAHDAAHVRNGLARLNQSKGKDKGKILACLRRRAKKYGIKVSTTVKNEEDESTIESVTISDLLLADATIEDILELDVVIQYLAEDHEDDSPASEPDTETNDEDTTTDSPSEDATDDTDPDVDTEEPDHNDEATEVSDLRKTIKDRDEEIRALSASKAELHIKIKEMVVDGIINTMLKLNRLTDDDVEDEKAKLMERTEDSLQDTMGDLDKETENTPDQPGEEADSNATLDNRDPNSIDTTTVKGVAAQRKLTREEMKRRYLPEGYK